MSCPDSTSPIDISLSSISGKCDLKCNYSFKYNDSSCTATNRGDYISLSYDASSSPPVLYNNSGYDVKEVRMYTPSLHSYNGVKTDGELIIVHSSITGAKNMLVCIPIKMNNSNDVSSILFTSVVDVMSRNAPTDGETTNVTIAKYNLDLIVPKHPYFSYSGTEPFQPCSTSVDLIVFGPLISALHITQDTLNNLKKIISTNSYDVKTGNSLFYNEKGPGKSGAGDEIYIDCQPVGQSDETMQIVTDTSYSTMSYADIINNPLFKIIMGSLIFIILLYVVSGLLGTLSPSKGGSISTVVG
jgi:carbonic anhydrase